MALSRSCDEVLRFHRIHEKFSDTSNCALAVQFFHQVDVQEILLTIYGLCSDGEYLLAKQVLPAAVLPDALGILIRIRQAQAGENFHFERFHLGGFLIGFVVVALRMHHAMDHQVRRVMFQRLALFFGFAL